MTRHIPDLVLERYRLNELPETSARAVEHMLAADPRLRERLDALDVSDADIRARYAPRLAIRDKRAPSRRLVLRALTASTVAVTALLVSFALPRTVQNAGDGDRIKGTTAARPALAVYRRTASGSERLADGDIAHAGDLLRVGYTSAGRAYGVILSIDGRGALTLHLPPRGSTAASLAQNGTTTLLDRAYELDDAPNVERFTRNGDRLRCRRPPARRLPLRPLRARGSGDRLFRSPKSPASSAASSVPEEPSTAPRTCGACPSASAGTP